MNEITISSAITGEEKKFKDIIVNGKTYHLTDFENHWTLRQQKFAKRILGKLFAEIAGSNVVAVDPAIIGYSLMQKVMDADLEKDILALIYLDEDEEYFKEESYRGRLTAFEDAMYTDNEQGVIEYFFATKGQSIMKDFQTCMTSLSMKGSAIQ